jgi:V-type H+-transporting ATPase subunit a
MEDMMAGIKVNYIVGTINTIDTDRFRRMIFRVSKGNAWVNLKNIDQQDLGQNYRDPKTLTAMEKDVFLIVYPGGMMDVLKAKLTRFCDSFNCNRFGIPENE